CAGRLSAADRVGAPGGGRFYAPARTQSGSGHSAGGEAGTEAAGQEKDPGCGSDPSRGAAAHGLGRPDGCASAGAGARPSPFGRGRVGPVRDRISPALALVPFPLRPHAVSDPIVPERWTLWPISVNMKRRKRRSIVSAREPAYAASRTPISAGSGRSVSDAG